MNSITSSDSDTTLRHLRDEVRNFVQERDWEQYHSPKNLGMSIAIEAAEIMEHFQWLDQDEGSRMMANPAQRAEVADELAEAIGAVVSCSRPIVDAKWLEKSRQVGTSGQTVKPKVYLALGISGSFQHLGGLKGNPFIVAVNKNPKAPIFQVADVGVVEDLLDFVPVLTEKIQES